MFSQSGVLRTSDVEANEKIYSGGDITFCCYKLEYDRNTRDYYGIYEVYRIEFKLRNEGKKWEYVEIYETNYNYGRSEQSWEGDVIGTEKAGKIVLNCTHKNKYCGKHIDPKKLDEEEEVRELVSSEKVMTNSFVMEVEINMVEFKIPTALGTEKFVKKHCPDRILKVKKYTK